MIHDDPECLMCCHDLLKSGAFVEAWGTVFMHCSRVRYPTSSPGVCSRAGSQTSPGQHSTAPALCAAQFKAIGKNKQAAATLCPWAGDEPTVSQFFTSRWHLSSFSPSVRTPCPRPPPLAKSQNPEEFTTHHKALCDSSALNSSNGAGLSAGASVPQPVLLMGLPAEVTRPKWYRAQSESTLHNWHCLLGIWHCQTSLGFNFLQAGGKAVSQHWHHASSHARNSPGS